MPEPVHKKAGQVEGQIIYIDRFGNLITNITKEHLVKGVEGQKSEDRSQKLENRIKQRKTTLKELFSLCNTIETVIGRKKVVGLSNTYLDVNAGEPLVLFGSAGFLEVSINQGNAQKYFRVDRGNKIRVEMGAYCNESQSDNKGLGTFFQ